MTGVLLSALVARAAPWEGTCDVDFAVKATMDSFVGKAASEPFVVPEEGGAVSIEVKIEAMQTGKKKRDVEMQHMFRAEQFPVITGQVTAEALQNPPEDEAGVPFTLTISGVAHELSARITDVLKSDDQISFTASFDVSCKAFGLKPPSILGLIRVGDTVKVTARCLLKKPGAAPAAP